jgi:catechol 2,3-dioxygenase-like lactoylglutathione lyase family enzyme
MKLALTAVFVKDMEKSKAFYSNVLGLETELDSGTHVSFHTGLSLWQEDAALSIIYGRHAAEGSGNRFELCFESPDLIKSYEHAVSSGAALICPITEQPWGQMVFRMYDPDGHIIEVAEAFEVTIKNLLLSGLSIDAVSARTTIPAAEIRKMLDSGA